MAAVYELSTIAPHAPAERRYGRAEWPIYCEGYYQALVMALRVMQLAARAWEGRPMDEPKPKLMKANGELRWEGVGQGPARDRWLRPVLIALITAGAVVTLELIVLLGALILRVVQ